MLFARLTLFIAVATSLVSCQPPAEPASLKETSKAPPPSAAAQTSEDVKKVESSAPVSLADCGSSIGTDTMKASVKECVAKRSLYDRQANKCTDLPLANVVCTMDGLKARIAPNQYDAIVGYMNDPAKLQGFVIDQILDCPDPAANPYCKGVGATPPSSKGIRLFLVKQNASAIAIQTIFIKSE